MENTEINLGIIFSEFKGLSREEKAVIRNKGNELCEGLAKEFLANNPGIDFVAYAFNAGTGEFYVAKKGAWEDVPSSSCSSPFNEYLNYLEKDIDKVVFTWNKTPMVEHIFMDSGDQGFYA